MMLSESNNNNPSKPEDVLNEKGGTPRTVSLASKKSGKYN